MVDFDAAEGDRIAISREGLRPPQGSGHVVIIWPSPPDHLALGPLSAQPEHFVANATGRPDTPGTVQFLYETDAGRLWWDDDGTAGGAWLIATFLGAPAITAADIAIIA